VAGMYQGMVHFHFW